MDTNCSCVFKEHEFLPSTWHDHLLMGSESSRMMVDRIPSGGREGGPFRQHIQQWGKNGMEQSSVCIVSHINSEAIYKLSEKGSINSIDLDCSLRNIERSTETHFALVVEQNNNLYISKQTVAAKRERWSLFSMHNLKRADFKRFIPYENESVKDEFPNFTFLGADIRFGYATISNTSQAQDEAVSGIDFWRVTVFHENAESANQSMRVLQLEHNTNVLLQELSDMHEHADITRREHAAHMAGLHGLQDEIARERALALQLRCEMEQHRSALEAAEAETRAAHAETEQLQELVASMDAERGDEQPSAEEVEQLQSALESEREKVADLEEKQFEAHETITMKDALINLLQQNIEQLNLEMVNQINEKDLDIFNLKAKYESASNNMQQALADTKDKNARLEALLQIERNRREQLERQLAASDKTLKDELRSLCSRMEADIAHERTLRLQLESDHRDEIKKVEAAARADLKHMEERIRAEQMTFMDREAQLLEEKRNLATSLQAATTKSALVEQRLSNQLLSASALHKSEVERIAQLEEELKQERENREQLESQLPKEDEDWEVVDEQ